MSAIILPGRPGWFGMVSPREEEMPEFLKVIAQGWRTPKRKWEDLWRLRRGELNYMLGLRNFRGPKYQQGVLHPVGFWFEPAAGGTTPNLQDVTHRQGVAAPTQARTTLAYDSDGSLEWWSGTGTVINIVYAAFTTQSDDANNHTNDWWPDQPDVNEGLNWDIRYLNEALTGTAALPHYFESAGIDRVSTTWYLLDTVSNEHLDADGNGAMGVHRTNGTAKSPNTGSGTMDVDVEIRATGSGSAVASHHIEMEVAGTV